MTKQSLLADSDRLMRLARTAAKRAASNAGRNPTEDGVSSACVWLLHIAANDNRIDWTRPAADIEQYLIRGVAFKLRHEFRRDRIYSHVLAKLRTQPVAAIAAR